MDDRTGKEDVALASRVALANRMKADVYISIHHNAGINGGTGGGTVVYHYCSTNGGVDMANRLYNCVVKAIGLVGNRSTKVKKTGYYVLMHTNMRAYLIEKGFMDSKTDVPIILTDSHATKTAQGILNCLIAEYGLKRVNNEPVVKEEPKEEPKEEANVRYCVQVGAFSKKANAESLLKKVEAAGFDAFITTKKA